MTRHEITGHTRIYGILADPVHHVKTPEVMNALLRARGVDAVLVPWHVAPADLAVAIEGLRAMRNFGGFIATVPHKSAMLALCDRVTDHARAVGAVNCVRREATGEMVGTMLDGMGFVGGLRDAGIEIGGARVYLAGAGGAARAIAFALAGAGVVLLTIGNRTEAKARDLAERIAARHPDLEISTEAGAVAVCDLVVNATSLGMRAEDPAPLDLRQIHARQIVAEVIMEPEVTPLLAAARARGCRIQPGRPMLAAQIEMMARHMGAIA